MEFLKLILLLILKILILIYFSIYKRYVGKLDIRKVLLVKYEYNIQKINGWFMLKVFVVYILIIEFLEILKIDMEFNIVFKIRILKI